MNDPERTEFERLKQRHARLEAELKLLAANLSRLEQRLEPPTPQPPQPSTQQLDRPSDSAEIVQKIPLGLSAKENPPETLQPAPAMLPIQAKTTPDPVPPIIPPEPVVPEPSVLVEFLDPIAASGPDIRRPNVQVGTEDLAFLKCACQRCGGQVD